VFHVGTFRGIDRRNTFVDNIKTDTKGEVCTDMEWLHLGQDYVSRRAILNIVMNFHDWNSLDKQDDYKLVRNYYAPWINFSTRWIKSSAVKYFCKTLIYVFVLLKFLQWWEWEHLSSAMWHRVVWYIGTKFSEEHAFSTVEVRYSIWEKQANFPTSPTS
jgi:hypothetical protein